MADTENRSLFPFTLHRLLCATLCKIGLHKKPRYWERGDWWESTDCVRCGTGPL